MLIGFQSDFLDDDGRMPVARNHVEPALSAAASAARLYQQRGQPVVAIGNQFRRRDYVMNLLRGQAALEGSPGARWDSRLPLDDIAFFANLAHACDGSESLKTIVGERYRRQLLSR